jgi:hypothetical protein
VSSAKSVDDLPSLLRDSLLPFQHEGVIFAINKGGRVMIADDMGLGSRIPRPLSLYRVFASSHAARLPPQKRYRPSPFAGSSVIIGPSSSSCQRACAPLGQRSWSVGCRTPFRPAPSRCGRAPDIAQCLQLTRTCAALVSMTPTACSRPACSWSRMIY